MSKIRNFCIIAHIDHGKSTMADRMLEITGTIEKRKMRNQVLDQMDLERERGITIKLQPVRMEYSGFILNLIDTPGHVDFTYEVSRSLAAVEGAIMLVDATQGIQAQTMANLYLALEQNLAVIPVINKIDLPAANIEKTKKEIIHLLGCQPQEIILASAKTGQGVVEVLKTVIDRVPAPAEKYNKMAKSRSNGDWIDYDERPLRALIFDSTYDEYRGVVVYVRIFDGMVKKGDKIVLLATQAKSEALDAGVFKPEYKSTGELKAGEIGYIVTGFRDVSYARVGDTVALTKFSHDTKALKGYDEVKPMVFAGIFPREGNEFEELREALAKLKLNDAALIYEPENSEALGFGFRCGFLGLLHLEIFQERLKREYNLNLIVTVPSVAYKVFKKNGEGLIIRSPQKLPDPSQTDRIEEPWVSLDIIAPKEYIGPILNLVQEKRGIYKNTEYIDETRVILHYEIPLVAILTDFYDKIKSASSGYASVNYDFIAYRQADVAKMDILVAEDAIEALAMIIYRDEAFKRGKEVVVTLKETLPKQMFAVKLQAAIGGKIIAAERISAMKKDVTAKLYGGDVTRKRKLLEKQKKGKKKMTAHGKGSVEIPSDTFIKLLKR
ncbi:elongation factor 4 [Candidatus Falkowbacteria bacterium RIFCSPLOWO2_12_FULL_45_13]|uniref:Elongation factor 4 n=2 Tax=Candidatus Falkowiibacteriota TaxID=1752728 RepID=A0A1F5SAX1_9BACT|nr:MAG: elongation factor 4 [Candidatus Falkowbacteria bacterium RIFCSPLOWO2_02_FULL_45_21]OGF29855.1 MAG: elongation factor 4 [Candidatus Falkowbacteria bacterium RIFCSPLOWO2_12_FULL_45_13]